jgi:hypothetical protein
VGDAIEGDSSRFRFEVGASISKFSKGGRVDVNLKKDLECRALLFIQWSAWQLVGNRRFRRDETKNIFRDLVPSDAVVTVGVAISGATLYRGIQEIRQWFVETGLQGYQ